MIKQNTRRTAVICFICFILLFLTGCSGFEGFGSGTKKISQKDIEASQKDEITVMAEDTVNKLAREKYIAPSLSSSFMQKYLDMDSFEELKTRTVAGIKATQNTADLTEKEFQLWKDIIKDKQMNQYTVSDLNKKKEELTDILNSMARENNESLLEFVNDNYGMSNEELKSFIEKQAQKYVQSDKDINNKQNQSQTE